MHLWMIYFLQATICTPVFVSPPLLHKTVWVDSENKSPTLHACLAFQEHKKMCSFKYITLEDCFSIHLILCSLNISQARLLKHSMAHFATLRGQIYSKMLDCTIYANPVAVKSDKHNKHRIVWVKTWVEWV